MSAKVFMNVGGVTGFAVGVFLSFLYEKYEDRIDEYFKKELGMEGMHLTLGPIGVGCVGAGIGIGYLAAELLGLH